MGLCELVVKPTEMKKTHDRSSGHASFRICFSEFLRKGGCLRDAVGLVDIADGEHAGYEHLARDGPFVQRCGALEGDLHSVEDCRIFLLAAGDQRAFLAEEAGLFPDPAGTAFRDGPACARR